MTRCSTQLYAEDGNTLNAFIIRTCAHRVFKRIRVHQDQKLTIYTIGFLIDSKVNQAE